MNLKFLYLDRAICLELILKSWLVRLEYQLAWTFEFHDGSPVGFASDLNDRGIASIGFAACKVDMEDLQLAGRKANLHLLHTRLGLIRVDLSRFAMVLRGQLHRLRSGFHLALDPPASCPQSRRGGH